MRVEWVHVKDKKRLASVLLVWVFMATNLFVVLPLTAPEAEALDHPMGSAIWEDMQGLPYDTSPIGDGKVIWDPNVDHVITAMDYIVEPGMTLIIPGMNYVNNRMSENEIWFDTATGADRIDVLGSMVTQSDGNFNTKIAFLAPPSGGLWDGIYFHGGSSGTINECLLDSATAGVVFESGSTITNPGIHRTDFQNFFGFGLQVDGAGGYTNMDYCNFYDTNLAGTSVKVTNCNFNFTDAVYIVEHGMYQPCIDIEDSDVYVYRLYLDGNNQVMPPLGELIYIGGDSNGTVFEDCDIFDGASGFYHVRVDGSTPLFDNCSFDTSGGELSISANDDATGVPAHPILRNPEGGTTLPFDNSTMNVTGSSSVTLQWYMEVYVKDPNGNPIPNAPVWIKDRYGNPADPPSKITDWSGFARWFICTELILYNDSVDNFNPFNASAENNSLIGYAIPDPIMDMSKLVIIIVPSGSPPPPPPPPAPSPPLGLQASLVKSGKDILLSWNASLDDGGGDDDVEGYTVYKSITGVNGTYLFTAWINATDSPSYNWTDLAAGDGDWNDYFYIVRANDTLDNEEKNINKVGKFVNYLVEGWNLISIPLIQVNTSKDWTLQTINGSYSAVMAYHAGKSTPWLKWHRNKPHYFNDAIEMNHKRGYYIDMLNPDYLIIAGKVPTFTEINIIAGWNLVGYPSLINKTRDDALSAIVGIYNIVEYFDPIIDKEVRLGPTDYMRPGLGYWIHTTAGCVWLVSY